jgi:MSHA biogenesis protein MshM
MYLAHFGLRELPFTITPDTSFFFAHSSCQDALNSLILATESGEGFIKVVGEVGTGKTLLCRKFLSALSGHYLTAYIPNPYMEPMTLLYAVADELGMDCSDQLNQHQLLKRITNTLLETCASHRQRVVLCLDEAQAMPVETLETLRLLSNLETERRKLLQVVLFGQPELDKRLSDPAIRQLKQRIAFACYLSPLGRDEVEFYVMHRLRVAGYARSRLFSRAAMKYLHRSSGGIPRLVNILAHKSLMAAFGEGGQLIRRQHVRQAVRDTESTSHRQRDRRQRLLRLSAALVASVLVMVGALYWRVGL